MANRTFCYYDKKFGNSGIGEEVFVAIFRERGNRPLEGGCFLVDLGCTGIKDAFYTQIEHEDLEAFKEDAFRSGCMEESAAWGRKLVEGALDYAKSLGLKPHSDYKKAARVLGGVRASDCDVVFHFGGKNGKPLYIQGAKHSDEAARRMVEYLSRRLGPDGFEFFVTANTALSETVEGRVEYFLEAAEAGLLKKAKNGLEELLEEHPEEAKVHFALGITKDYEDDHEGALDYYDQAVDLDPDLTEAWINKAHAHRILGDTVNMILGLRQVCELTTTDDEFHLRAKEDLDEIANSLQEFEGLTVDAFLDAEQLFSQAYGYYQKLKSSQKR